MNAPLRWLVGLAAIGAFGCGGARAMLLTTDRADPVRAAAALARIDRPAHGPINRTGRALALLVSAQGRLVSYDLDARRERWRVAAGVTPPVVIGRSFVAAMEGERLVGRDLTSGRKLWSRWLRASGIAAGGDRLFVVDRQRAVWVLRALDGRAGRDVWRVEAPGALGPPVARGDLVFCSFVGQWLIAADAETGEEVARVRGGEAIAVRAGGDGVFYGSGAGVFRLDRAAAGRPMSPALPLAARALDWTGADPGRPMLLWRARGLRFEQVVVHAGRTFAGIGARGGPWMWVLRHPDDLVGAAHVGPAIAFATAGGLGALDPATGASLYAAPFRDGIAAVTFDAEGWHPSRILSPGPGAGAPPIAK